MTQTCSEVITAPPALLSAGSGDLLRCVPRCLLLRFRSNSSHIGLHLLLRPPAPSPPAALPAGHALLTPPAPAPPAAGQVPAAPFHAAAAATSHSPIHPAAPPPQPSANRPHEPLWQSWGGGARLWPAALWPGCPPIRDSLLFFPPLARDATIRRKQPVKDVHFTDCSSLSENSLLLLFSCLFSNASCDITEVT